jgi:protein ImuA
MSLTKTHIISQLRKDILLLQGFKPLNAETNDSPLAIIKDSFPNATFPVSAVHEFFCTNSEDNSASCGFISGIVSSLMSTGAPTVWISNTENTFPPALKQFGIDPGKIIFISSKKPKEVLWAIEEALKCDCVAAVIGEINEISFTESRRLQLAVEGSKATGFLVRQNPRNLSTACVTRWRIKSLPTEKKSILPGIAFPRWNVELLKVRNGKPGSWQMEWRGEKFHLIQQATFTIQEQQRKVV